MAGPATHENPNLDPKLAELRLLTEVNHLLGAMQPDGTVSDEVQEDVRTNLQTATYEIAMPLAVSTTLHRVEYREGETGHRERIITWLGRNAVANAINGKRYHQSAAAHKRVDVEVAEARYAQDSLRSGVAQVFISPKMSEADASSDIAKVEHLYADDSLRVSYAITNKSGEVIARRLESLLVSDIPLDAWVALLKDPHNMFGGVLHVRDEASALSVMELFRDLELPEASILDGPVALVAAVLPYIKDEAARASVWRQLDGFRKDQAFYKAQAEHTSQEWLEFELELAKSLKFGEATPDIRRLIITLQDKWDDETLQIIQNHQLENAEFIMTKQLAAVLERAKRNILGSIAALATNNEKVLTQVDAVTAQSLQDNIRFLAIMQANGAQAHELAALQAQLERRVAAQNFRVGGGCMGENQADFQRPDGGLGDRLEGQSAESDKKDWKWKLGKCQVKSCPSPKPTEVGPCSVCRRCQHMFDAGKDPTKVFVLASLFTRDALA